MANKAIVNKSSDTKRESSALKSNSTVHKQAAGSPAEGLLHLHRTIGNRAVQRLFESGAIQPRLKIGTPGDIYEREADSVADTVMRMPDNKSVNEGAGQYGEIIMAKPG